MNRRLNLWAWPLATLLLACGANAQTSARPQTKTEVKPKAVTQVKPTPTPTPKPNPDSASTDDQHPTPVDGEFLVSWKSEDAPLVLATGVSPAPWQQQQLSYRLSTKLPGTRIKRTFKGSGWSLIKAPGGQSGAAFRARLASLLGTANVSFNFRRHAAKVPNDPDYTRQWQWPQIKAPQAWDIQTGSPSVVVAVLDSGIDLTHPDIVANLWKNPGEIANNGKDDDGDGYIDDVYGINTTDPDNPNATPQDDAGHGTHCAGLIGAVGNNGKDLSGVCWNVKIMALKFLTSSGDGTDADAITCLEYALDMKSKGVNLKIISNSWSGSDIDPALEAEFSAVDQAGVLTVCAAGNAENNRAINIDTNPRYPASYAFNSLVSVAASDAADNLASFSNYGVKGVDLAAPGANILSLWLDGGEQLEDGTSMATPIVAGAAALLASKEPALTAVEIKARLLATVDPIAALKGKLVSGGRLNLQRALTNATLSITGKVTRLSGSTSVPLAGALIKLNGTTITSSASDGTYTLTDIAAGTATVTASLSGFTFPTVSLALPRPSGESGAPNGSANLVGTPTSSNLYSLSGKAINVSGSAQKGVSIFIVGIPEAVAVTDSLGQYSISNRAAGTYKLTATLDNIVWTPNPTSITLSDSVAQGVIDFKGSAPDTKAPTVKILAPADGSTLKPGIATAVGTATDLAGVAKLFFQLSRDTDSAYYDWAQKIWTLDSSAPGTTGIQTVSGTSVNWSQALPSLANDSYTLTVYGEDALGNQSDGPQDANSIWTVDSSSTPTTTVSLAIAPTSISGGTNATGIITLSAAAPSGGLSFDVSSSDTSIATVPASVIVPRGAKTATFSIATLARSNAANVTIIAKSPSTGVAALVTLAVAASTATPTPTPTSTPTPIPTSSATITITTPASDNLVVASLPTASGTAKATAGRTVSGVTVRLYRYAATGHTAGYWAGGTTWTSGAGTANEIAATGTTSWKLTLPSLTEGQYTLRATSTDSGNTKTFSAIRPFWIETTKPSLSIADVKIIEGNSGTANATFKVTLSKVSGRAVTVKVANAAGATNPATAGADYTTLPSTTLSFASGETNKTVVVPIVGDLLDELDETFKVVLSSATNATIARSTAIGTIVDNDATPSLSINDVSVEEGNSGSTSATFTVTLSAASGQTVTVKYATANATALAGSDYSAVSGTLTLKPGVTSVNVVVKVIGDTANEANEQFKLLLSSSVNATIKDSSGLATIVNDDATPSLSIADLKVIEGNSGTSNATFKVTLSRASGLAVAVKYATANGTTNPATAGKDYTALRLAVLSFAPGETSKTIAVPIVGDLLDELDETYSVVLSAPSKATIARATAVGTIGDDDATPSLSINDVSVTEGNSGNANATFTVTLSAASGRIVTVDYATSDATALAGSDYIAKSGTLTFAPGATGAAISVPITGDLLNELNEQFTVKLSGSTNATINDSIGLATIVNDDAAPTISVNAPSVTEGDSDTVPLDFIVSLSAPSGRAVSLQVETTSASTDPATSGADYVAYPSTPVTFAPGETSKTVSITVNGDLLDEADEHIGLQLSMAVNATLDSTYAEGTIVDNDATPSLSIDDVSVLEGDSGGTSATFTVTLSAPSGRQVTVDYGTASGTALENSDFTPQSGTLTFAPGQTTQQVSVTVIGDTEVEGDEQFNVVLSNPVNSTIASGTGTGTISNDDGMTGVFPSGGTS